MWLIEWLADRYSKVLSWFGNKFWDFYDRVSNFFNHLHNMASNAFSQARNWAWPRIIEYYEKAKNYARGIREGFHDWVRSKVADAVDYLLAKIHAARNYAESLLNSVWGWVEDKVQTVRALVYTIRDWLLVKIDAAVTALESRLSGIIESHPVLRDIVSFLSEDNRRKILDLINTGFENTVLFATNPIGFTVAVLRPILLRLLNYSLAYALGTVNAELPPFPSFDFGGGAGGGAGGSFTIPPSQSGLTMPLNRIYVSGYRFTPEHPAIDLGLVNGDPVFAMHDGRVTVAGPSSVGYGLQVVISGSKYWTRYAHLMAVNVAVGYNVRAGQLIGLGDSTGQSSGPHLHLEIKRNGRFIDPLTVLIRN